MKNKTKMIAVVLTVVFALSLVTSIGLGAFGRTSSSPELDGVSRRGGMRESMRERKEDRNVPKMTTLAFHDDWRKLWEDHVWWTRMVIIGVFDDLAGNGNYTERLLKNAVDMQDALKPFYGDNATQFGNLVRDHLLIAAEILVAAKAGNTTQVDDAVARWYANGNQTAELMHALNPRNWPLAEAKSMWKEHLDLTLEEALAHLHKDWAADVEAFDKIHVQALMMADFFSKGVVLQFPSMFIMLGTIVRP